MRGLGVSFCFVFLHNSLMNILQKIFIDYYEEIKFTLHPRNAEMENINKMIHCGDPAFGGAMYGCPHCGKLKNLRSFFLKDRSLLDCLFHSVASVISRMFFKMNKSKNFTPGFIMVLHTFGRDLKWNPHIHCLISEGGYSDDGFWSNVKIFSYTYLRNAFRTALLNELEARIGDSFKKVKAKCYSDHKEGFYVFAKPNICNPSTVIKYIGRYLGRPVIATSRIDKYDCKMVTFHYNRHEDNKYIQETIPAMDFIQRLIQHIPEKHFKMIRYGGLYAHTAKSIPSFTVPFPETSTISTVVSTNGELPFSLLLVMTPWNARIASTKWYFLNSITIMNAYPSKNFTRKQCPNLVESVLLRDFF